jgi:riboflavin kinase/FMN adenylyltransferase
MRVLRPGFAPPALTTFDEKVALLRESGLDRLIWREFTAAFSAFEPAAFVREIVLGQMHASGVVCGPNYRFGRGAQGGVAELQALGAELGFEVEAVTGVTVDDSMVSSTRVRALVGEGAVSEAARLLGRDYSARAEVVHGDGRGRTIGYPTANLAVPPEKLLPADGVYAVRLVVDGMRHAAVANLGVRPTFSQHQRVLEVHILDFNDTLYGRTVTVEFARRIRGELKFDGVSALVAQIGRDVERARELLLG